MKEAHRLTWLKSLGRIVALHDLNLAKHHIPHLHWYGNRVRTLKIDVKIFENL